MPLLKRARQTTAQLLNQLSWHDWVFVGAIIGLATVIGMSSSSGPTATQLLIILSSALAGMMLPHIRSHRRAEQVAQAERAEQVATAAEVTEEQGRRDADERARRHDMAAALLTIEGGISALRTIQSGEHSPINSIVGAIESEIARIRRLSERQSHGRVQCELQAALTPIVALHAACGMSIDTQVTPALVGLPADDLARVVANLLDNCARHAPDARVTISTRLVADRCIIAVSDDGPGIAPELATTAIDLGTSTRPGGGVGLYSAAELLDKHGARLIVASNRLPAAGACIELDLPLAIDRRSRGSRDNAGDGELVA